jgi:hypothetical protein
MVAAETAEDVSEAGALVGGQRGGFIRAHGRPLDPRTRSEVGVWAGWMPYAS